jgi:predicted transcriptional regulator
MLNTNSFANRLKKVMDFYNVSASSFAETIEVPRSSISHILSGRNKPSLDFVLKTIETYQEVDLYWLLKGIGHFPKNTSSPPDIKTLPIKKNIQELKKEETPTLEPQPIFNQNDSAIEKVFIFYKDGTFKEYRNRN